MGERSYGQGDGETGLFANSMLTICAVGSGGTKPQGKYVLSNVSVMQSFGETNCGSIGPPAPIES